jgi:hypothetical protein
MSRPSADQPGALRKARCRNSSASRTAGKRGHFRGAGRHFLGADGFADLPHRTADRTSRKKPTSSSAAIAATPASSAQATPARWRPARSGGRARRSRGSASPAPRPRAPRPCPCPRPRGRRWRSPAPAGHLGEALEIVGEGLGHAFRVVDAQRRAEGASEKHIAMRWSS